MRRAFDIIVGKMLISEDAVIVYECFFKRDIEGEIKNLLKIKESFFGDIKIVYLGTK